VPAVPEVYWYYFTINIGGKICYYGAQGSRTGASLCLQRSPPSYQLTVYNAGFDVPQWFQKSVMYQIFPDRFRRSDDQTAKKGIYYHRLKGRKSIITKSGKKSRFSAVAGRKGL